jgi:hypothetical protein
LLPIGLDWPGLIVPLSVPLVGWLIWKAIERIRMRRQRVE